MAVVGEQVILRRRRSSSGEPQPHRIRLDKLQTGDELVVEIVIDRKNDVRRWFHFLPEMLENRRGVVFRASGEEIYWLSGLRPKPILESTARKLLPAPETKRRGRKPSAKPVKTTDPDWHRRKRGPKVMKVLIFDVDARLMAICPTTEQAARLTNIRPEAITKMCKTKRPSFDTGLSFRHWWRKIQDVDMTDFTLTVTQYDAWCKRKISSEKNFDATENIGR